jgi:hypothetical protein
MILWTIQSIAAWRLWKKRRVMCTDGRRINPYFRNAYRWLGNEMDERVGQRPPGVRYPVWAWYQYESSRKMKPDLRSSGLEIRGAKCVRVEFEADTSQVLLSDFDRWHHVLMGSYLPESEEDDERFDRLVRGAGLSVSSRVDELPSHLRDKIILSWNRIFDLDTADPYIARPQKKKSIQATVWKVDMIAVSDVTPFIAR